MLCYVYRSYRKDNFYLFLNKKDNFAILPLELQQTEFKRAKFVMSLVLSKTQHLLGVDKVVLQDRLKQQGYYLHIAPSIEDLFSLKE